MPIPNSLRNSTLLRRPLLAAVRRLLQPLRSGPALLRRAAYDAMPVPYLVTGHPEHFVVSTADKVIGRAVFLHGQFDFHKLEAALAILAREGHPAPTHLIDVGANIGTITIPAIKRGLMQTATAIEPHPGNLRLLRANLALNEVDQRVAVLAHAVGEMPDARLFLQESATNSGHHSIGPDGIAIRSGRLDDLPFPERSLLWMDIEGYEGHAMSGAAGLLATGIPVVCEYNPLFLKRSGGLERCRNALEGRELFDLNDPGSPSTTLDDLETRYQPTAAYTDILAIARQGGTARLMHSAVMPDSIHHAPDAPTFLGFEAP